MCFVFSDGLLKYFSWVNYTIKLKILFRYLMLLTREDSFKTLPMGDQQIIPAQKTPKLIFVLFFLFFLVVAAEGAYYFYLRSSGETPGLLTGIWKKKEADETGQIGQEVVNECGSSENPCPSPNPNINRYFEGLRYYEEVNGEKRLLVIEGVVKEVNLEDSSVALAQSDISERFQYKSSDSVYIFTPGVGDKEAGFSDLEVGDFVSYHPADEDVDREVTWIIQKQ